MPDPVVLVDQGNTRLKWILAQSGEIDVTRAGHGELAEFRRVFTSQGIRPGAVILSSVAGQETILETQKVFQDLWGIEARLAESRHEQGGVRSAYAAAGSLGVDRWLAIIGAVGKYGKPVIIWDLGTASTLDAVDEKGQHLGGFIYPGPATMLNSLRQDTKLQVPKDLESGATGAMVEQMPGVAPGDSTEACISRGVLAAQLGAMNQFTRHVSARMEQEPKLIVTGGAAEHVLPLLKLDHSQDPWLVFRGMLIE